MMHNILVAAVFVAMVLAPCVLAMFSGMFSREEAQDSNVFEEGFI